MPERDDKRPILALPTFSADLGDLQILAPTKDYALQLQCRDGLVFVAAGSIGSTPGYPGGVAVYIALNEEGQCHLREWIGKVAA
jgi:hypothetical protein